VLVEPPSDAMVIKLSAVTVLLDEGDSVSTSPAADPEYATVIVPMEAAAALLNGDIVAVGTS
jgi:hypothetical protein